MEFCKTLSAPLLGEATPLRVLDVHRYHPAVLFGIGTAVGLGTALLVLLPVRGYQGVGHSVGLLGCLVVIGVYLFSPHRLPRGTYLAPDAAAPIKLQSAELVQPLVLSYPVLVNATPVPDSVDSELVLSVNGTEHRISNPSPSLLLSDFLRSLGLTGVKVACGEGGCGACTVIIVGADGEPRAINACLRLLCACDGLAVTTVEGLGSQATGFSKAQQAIADGAGSQCGFCTPGWVTAMSALLASHAGKPLSAKEIEASFDGNLCRCTGYRPILQAFKGAFADDALADLEELATTACHDVRSGQACGRECDGAMKKAAEARDEAARATAAPASLRARSSNAARRSLCYQDAASGLAYHRPSTLASLMSTLQSAGPAASIICANTGMGVRKYYDAAGPTGAGAQPAQQNAVIVDVSSVDELTSAPRVSADGASLTAGASVTLEALRSALVAASAADAAAAPIAETLARHLGRVATTQVRSVASWAGNLALAAGSPLLPSDLATILAATGATLTVVARKTNAFAAVAHPSSGVAKRQLSVAEFVQRGVPAKCPDVIVSITIPLRAATHGYSDKTSQRHANAHAIVNAAIFFEADPKTGIVASCGAAFGGVLASGLFVPKAAAALIGSSLRSETVLRDWVGALVAEASAAGLAPSTHNSSDCRLSLLKAFAYKAFLRAQPALAPNLISAVATSLAAIEDRAPSVASQQIDVSDASLAPVSLPLPKLSARLQASGEAVYPSDLASAGGGCLGTSSGALFAAFVSTPAGSTGSTLLSVDGGVAADCPGFVALVTAADFPTASANRNVGDTTQTTPSYLLEPNDAVPCVGAHVAVVVADTLAHARYAAKQVRLGLSAASPQQLAAAPPGEGGGKQGVGAQSFRTGVLGLVRSGLAAQMGLPIKELDAVTAAAIAVDAAAAPGDGGDGDEDDAVICDDEHWGVLQGQPPRVWRPAAKADPAQLVVQGKFVTGGQKHFFMETHSAIAFPEEDGRLVLWCGTQNPRRTQTAVAQVLGVGANRVDVRMRRTGGAFGGKLNAHLPTAVMAAVAARKLGRAVQLHNERADDMSSSGGRAPLDAKFVAAVERQSGKILSLEMKLTFDSGCTDGAGGGGDLGMAVKWSDNCYFHANFLCKGGIVTTPYIGNTAVRAPGVIQSIAMHEFVIEACAEALGLSPEDVRETNMYAAGQTTPWGTTLGTPQFNWLVPALWQQAKTAWKVAERRADVEAFNSANRWRKRGLCMMPVKYGVSTANNPMPAAVRIYADDGSVHVSHGGCEVGQGIHTKVAQAVAMALGCPLENVVVGDTSAIETPNATDTGGSIGSECCVAAALDACHVLTDALAPYRAAGAWKDVVSAAGDANVPLASVGHYVHETADAFDYATQGVCCVEVLVDALTGEMQISRADIVMDQGTPLNPLVDVGQAEGGFMMALGFYLTEEVLWSSDGSQLTLGCWEYKVPAVHDIPLEWNISFVQRAPNPAPSAILKSKASGEPPMALGAAAVMAARNAIRAAKSERVSGEASSREVELELPLTCERIQLACGVDASEFVLA